MFAFCSRIMSWTSLVLLMCICSGILGCGSTPIDATIPIPSAAQNMVREEKSSILELHITYDVAQPLPAVVDWYTQQLPAQGWYSIRSRGLSGIDAVGYDEKHDAISDVFVVFEQGAIDSVTRVRIVRRWYAKL